MLGEEPLEAVALGRDQLGERVIERRRPGAIRPVDGDAVETPERFVLELLLRGRDGHSAVVRARRGEREAALPDDLRRRARGGRERRALGQKPGRTLRPEHGRARPGERREEDGRHPAAVGEPEVLPDQSGSEIEHAPDAPRVDLPREKVPGRTVDERGLRALAVVDGGEDLWCRGGVGGDRAAGRADEPVGERQQYGSGRLVLGVEPLEHEAPPGLCRNLGQTALLPQGELRLEQLELVSGDEDALRAGAPRPELRQQPGDGVWLLG